jgi:type IV pilus assembly protein PilQ
MNARATPRAMLLLALVLSVTPAAAAPPVDERITLSLDHVPLSRALESFALEYRLNIVAGAEVTGDVTLHLFAVPVEEALRAMLAANGYGYRRSGDLYIVERLDPNASETAVAALESRVVFLDWLRAEEALRLIEPLKSPDGVYAAGAAPESGLQSDPSLGGGNDPASGEVLVLKDRKDVLDEVERTLRTLDRRPRQVLVEAVVLEVRLSDETRLGIDFNTLSGVDFADLGGISNFNTIGLAPVTDPLLFGAGVESAGTSGFASDVNTDGLHVGILRDDVAVFIEALERVTDTTVLASPRVMAIDRQKAEIIIGAKLGYQTATTTETATVQQVEFLDIGTQLRFRPFIASDGYVRFEIHPENSTGVVDAVSGLPSETTTEVTTNVIVKDGSTIAIGGLISDQVETVVKQVPLLGSIPLIGVLFRQSVETVTRKEVIVMLTPRIIDPSVEDEGDLALADAMANSRDLLLAEHLPLSRARIAKPLLELGEAALARGDGEIAAAYADAALFLLPAELRAAKLKRRAYAALGTRDSETRVLETLKGMR